MFCKGEVWYTGAMRTYLQMMTGLVLGLVLSVSPLAQAGAKEALPAAAVLRVMSDPAGAQVFLGDELKGETPLECELGTFGKGVVRVSQSGYRDAWQSVELESGVTRSLNVKLEPMMAAIVVHTEPAGAAISLDGAHVGEGPLLLPQVALGKHRVVVTQPGFQPRTVELDVPNAVPQRVNVSLVTDSATLRVVTDPEGAQVFLNGMLKGASPVVIERIPDGDVSLEVRAAGYKNSRQDLRVSAGDNETVTATLDPQPASLQVVTIPAGARVYVDNSYKGESPVRVAELVPGSYRVRVELAAHDPAARTIELGRAMDVTEEFRLVPNCGGLLVTTSPAEVTVLVDGKVRGVTTAKPEASDQISEKMEVGLVAAGTRELVFTREGYHEVRKTVEVQRDKVETVDVVLRRRFIPNYEVRTAENTYKGVFQSRTAEFVRLETEPGVIRSFPVKAVLSARMLRDEERVEIP